MPIASFSSSLALGFPAATATFQAPMLLASGRTNDPMTAVMAGAGSFTNLTEQGDGQDQLSLGSDASSALLAQGTGLREESPVLSLLATGANTDPEMSSDVDGPSLSVQNTAAMTAAPSRFMGRASQFLSTMVFIGAMFCGGCGNESTTDNRPAVTRAMPEGINQAETLRESAFIFGLTDMPSGELNDPATVDIAILTGAPYQAFKADLIRVDPRLAAQWTEVEALVQHLTTAANVRDGNPNVVTRAEMATRHDPATNSTEFTNAVRTLRLAHNIVAEYGRRVEGRGAASVSRPSDQSSDHDSPLGTLLGILALLALAGAGFYIARQRKTMKGQQQTINDGKQRLREAETLIKDLSRKQVLLGLDQGEQRYEDIAARLQAAKEKNASIKKLQADLTEVERDNVERAAALRESNRKRYEEMREEATRAAEEERVYKSLKRYRDSLRERLEKLQADEDEDPAVTVEKLREKIEEFNSAIKERDRLQAELDGLKSDNEGLDQQKVNLQAEIDRLQPIIFELRREVGTLAGQARDLRAKKEQQESARDDFNESIITLKSELHALGLTINSLGTEKAELEREKTSLIAKRDAVTAAIAQLRGSIAELEAALPQLAAERGRLDEQKSQLEPQVEEQTRLRNAAQEAYDTTLNTLNGLKDDERDFTTRKTELEDEIGEKEGSIESLKSTIGTLEARKNTLNTELTETKEKHDKLAEEIPGIERATLEAQAALADLITSHEDKVRIRGEEEAKAQAKSDAVAEQDRIIGELRAQIEQDDLKYNARLATAQSERARRGALRQEIARIEAEIRAYEIEMDGVSAIDAQLQEATERSQYLETAQFVDDEEANAAKIEMSELADRLGRLQRRREEMDLVAQRVSLRAELEPFAAAGDHVSGQAVELQLKIDALTERISAGEAGLTAQRDELSAMRGTLRSSRDELESELERLTETVRQLSGEVDGLKQRLREKNEQLEGLQSEDKGLNADIRSRETDISLAEGEIQRLKGVLEQTQERKEAAEAEARAKFEEQQQLNEQIAAARQRAQEIHEDILQKGIQKAEAEAARDDLQQRYAQVESQVLAVWEQVTEVYANYMEHRRFIEAVLRLIARVARPIQDDEATQPELYIEALDERLQEVQQVIDQVGTAEHRHEDMVRASEQLGSMIQRVEQQVVTMESGIGLLTEKDLELQNRIAELKGEIEEFKAHRAEVTEQRAERDRLTAEYPNEQYQNVDEELTDLRNRVPELQGKANQLDILKGQISGIAEQYGDLDNAIAQEEALKQEAQDELDERNRRLAELDKSKGELAEQSAAVQASIDEAGQEIKDREAELAEAEAEQERVRAQITEREKARDEANEALDVVRAEAERVQGQIEYLKGELEKFQQNQPALVDQHAQLHKAFQVITYMTRRMGDIQSQLEALQPMYPDLVDPILARISEQSATDVVDQVTAFELLLLINALNADIARLSVTTVRATGAQMMRGEVDDVYQPPIVKVAATPDMGELAQTATQGMGRKYAEDTVTHAHDDNRNLYILDVDGMGGHEKGDVAAEIATEQYTLTASIHGDPIAALRAANTSMRQTFAHKGDKAPGACAVSVRIRKPEQAGGAHHADFNWLGDTRAIVLRRNAAGKWQWLYRTVDQNMGLVHMQAGALKPGVDFEVGGKGLEMALLTVPNNNVVISALGQKDEPDIKYTKDGHVPAENDWGRREATEFAGGVPLQRGDVVLMGSDGLFGNFGNIEMIANLIQYCETAEEIIQVLTREAHERMAILREAKRHLKNGGRWPFEHHGRSLFIDSSGKVYEEANSTKPFDIFNIDNFSASVYLHNPTTPRAPHLGADDGASPAFNDAVTDRIALPTLEHKGNNRYGLTIHSGTQIVEFRRRTADEQGTGFIQQGNRLTIYIDSPRISRQGEARMIRDADGVYQMQDLGKANGVRVFEDGQPVRITSHQNYPVQEGGVFFVGDYRFDIDRLPEAVDDGPMVEIAVEELEPVDGVDQVVGGRRPRLPADPSERLTPQLTGPIYARSQKLAREIAATPENQRKNNPRWVGMLAEREILAEIDPQVTFDRGQQEGRNFIRIRIGDDEYAFWPEDAVQITQALESAASILTGARQERAREILAAFNRYIKAMMTSARPILTDERRAQLQRAGLTQADLVLIEEAVGQNIAGQYEIKELIGMGQQSLIFRAYDHEEGQDVVVRQAAFSYSKLDNRYALAEHEKRRKQLGESFRAQIKDPTGKMPAAIKAIEAPAIIPAARQSEPLSKELYVIEEYVNGSTINEVIQSPFWIRMPLEERERWLKAWMGQFIEFWGAYQQAGYHYSDINPDNLMVDDETSGLRVVDAGSLRPIQNIFIQGGPLAYTPGYTTPKLLEMIKGHSRRSMQTSPNYLYPMLGKLMHHILTGEAPQQAGVMPDMPALKNSGKASSGAITVIDRFLAMDGATDMGTYRNAQAAFKQWRP